MFRKAFIDQVLVVFIVGETPTAGVNHTQFQFARAYMRAIQEPVDNIRILEASICDSFDGLWGLIKNDSRATYMVRGTATGCFSGRQFQNSVDFKSAMANTFDQQRYLREALNDLGIHTEQAASLIEDESAFGQEASSVASQEAPSANFPSPQSGCFDPDFNGKPVRVFAFPRDISHLRNAYREAVAPSNSNDKTRQEIEFSIKDSETGEDSIPVFSGSQSPISQYGILNKITAAIRRDRIRLVHINATNVLDMLFLADVLKRQCPDTRLLLNYPDVLLIQAAQNQPLSGTLVLSSYPGFLNGSTDSQRWTFSDANSEGIYDAAVLLLNRKDSDSAKILQDYWWGTQKHPPTWLLTLDHEGFLHIDVFPHDRESEVTESWFARLDTHNNGSRVRVFPKPPRMWNFLTTVLTLLSIILSVWVFQVSRGQKLELDARFSVRQIKAQRSDSEEGWRRFYILVIFVVLFAIQAVLWIPAWRSHSTGVSDLVGIYLIPALGCISIFCVGMFLVIQLYRNNRALTAWLVSGMTILLILLLGLWLAASSSTRDRSLFFAFRALELRFGSSPTWPVLGILTAVALFAFVHMTRLYTSVSHKPEVAMDRPDKRTVKPRLHQAWEEFNIAFDSAAGLPFRSRIGILWVFWRLC